MVLLDIIVLWIHIFAAIIFIGGSFFMWLVVWPASYDVTDDERLRTKIVGKIAKRFAYFTHGSLLILILTGLYNMSWYLPSPFDFSTIGGKILLAKIFVVVAMIVIMYSNNVYHGKKIMRLSSEGKLDQVKKIRKITHLISFVTLGLLVVITILATAMQFY